MKKLLMISAIAIAMFCFVKTTSAQSMIQTFNYGATVQKYIEVGGGAVGTNANRKVMGFAATLAGNSSAVLMPGGGHTYMGSQQNVVYANTPFSVTYNGNNAALDALPILAQQETTGGTGNGSWDRLQTGISIGQYINNYAESFVTKFISNPDGANTGTWTNQTVSFINAPHNGEVEQDWYFDVALPHASPDFTASQKSQKLSADAGTGYACTIIATYTAI